ncbi:uncharacterized protein LJ206_004937 isoform 1-T1 [Theristicus caerulescens]
MELYDFRDTLTLSCSRRWKKDVCDRKDKLLSSLCSTRINCGRFSHGPWSCFQIKMELTVTSGIRGDKNGSTSETSSYTLCNSACDTSSNKEKTCWIEISQ